MKWPPSGNEIKKQIVLTLIAGGVAWGVSKYIAAWAKRKKATYDA